MFKNLFKRKEETPPPYDYGAAFAKLATACQKCKVYSVVLFGVYYDVKKGMFAVHFECAQKEYRMGGKRKKYYLTVRRDEKMWGNNLEDLLDYAITYANFEDAFMRSPQDNLPDGITMSIKNIVRTPNNHPPSLPSWKL